MEVRATVPENPFRLVKVTITLPDDPWATVSVELLRAILKSGTVEACTLNVPNIIVGWYEHL